MDGLMKKNEGQVSVINEQSSSQRAKDREFVVYGLNASMNVFSKRPEDLLRVFFHEDRSSKMRAVKKWCQTHKLPYRQLDNESLNKVAASVHHEGVVMVVRPMKHENIRALIRGGLSKKSVVVALDRVSNTHNLGAILRVSAYFGIAAMIVEADENQRFLTPSAARMAEGGMEDVPSYRCGDLASALRDLKAKGAFVLGADLESKESIYVQEIRFPCVVVVGNEREGLSERVKKRCDALVHVPGKGQMQSLNVAVASGVILAELNRRQIMHEE